ncbi:hypothetical protein CYMTET_33158 [Cymbomonas tetramitiformis]|uniref:Uncharacterized protein n=1 Tax=Cymbomonas tetramitiformis TaxID=36881 RepID=A0AAE0FDF6_9CHLO|nr:hypothetical protein CYMTET_33158 [Cymbomonas tetramitiformis]
MFTFSPSLAGAANYDLSFKESQLGLIGEERSSVSSYEVHDVLGESLLPAFADRRALQHISELVLASLNTVSAKGEASDCKVVHEVEDIAEANRNDIPSLPSTLSQVPHTSTLHRGVFWDLVLRVRTSKPLGNSSESQGVETMSYRAFVLETFGLDRESESVLLRLQPHNRATRKSYMAPKAATDADAPTRRGTSTAAHDNISRRGDLSVDTAARLEPAILSPTERNHQEVSSRILAENTGEDPSEDLASFEVGTEQSCIDRALEDGSAWRDTEGYSCYEYIKYNWCSSTSSDGYGSDWADAWGNFENWSDDLTVCSEPTHHTPVYSCCDCGGGEVVVRECGAVNADEMVLDVVVASKEDGADIDWKLLAGSDTGAVLSKGSNYEPHSNHVTKMCLLNNTEYTLQLVALDSAGWSGGHVSLWSEESLHAVGAGCALLFEGVALNSAEAKRVQPLSANTLDGASVGMEERGTSNFTFNFTSDSACLNPSVPVNYTSNGEPVIVASNFYYAGRQLAQLVNDTHVVLLNSNVVLGNPLPILSEKDLEVTGICHGDAISNRSGAPPPSPTFPP